MNPSIDHPVPERTQASRWRGKGAWRWRLLRTAVFVAFLAPLTCTGIHDDELQCEEAAAQLRSCCPSFDPTIVSCSVNPTCGGSSPHPQLSLDLSSCILGRSCDELNADTDGKGSTCERASKPDTSLASICP